MEPAAAALQPPAWAFLSGLGVLFTSGFMALTATWAYLALRLRERAEEARVSVLTDALEPDRWTRWVELRGALAADLERSAVVSGSVPVLALLGTVMGFFFALAQTGRVGLGSSDPTAILSVMLDSGLDTALATTVAGQGLYLLMGLSHAAFVTGPVERADILLRETLERERVE